MSAWPRYDSERLNGLLLRVDLHEGRYLAVREYQNVVNHLIRSAVAAYLLMRDEEGDALVARAGARMIEWIEFAANGTKVPDFADLAAVRGLLMLALAPDAAAPESAAQRGARAFLEHTANAAPGVAHNARLAAALLVGDTNSLATSARACELSDAGLGLPWRRFAQALDARDPVAAVRAAQMWLRERTEATATNEWVAYNELPLEVSAALRLADLRGMPVRIDSAAVLPRFRGLSVASGR